MIRHNAAVSLRVSLAAFALASASSVAVSQGSPHTATGDVAAPPAPASEPRDGRPEARAWS
jgi:hypothetical protein